MAASNISIDIRLNLEGEWPRSTYLAHCQRDGTEYTEDGYLQWRSVGERLTGRPCFETTVKRASAALAGLGITMAQAGESMRRVFEVAQTHEENDIHSRRLADTDR